MPPKKVLLHPALACHVTHTMSVRIWLQCATVAGYRFKLVRIRHTPLAQDDDPSSVADYIHDQDSIAVLSC